MDDCEVGDDWDDEAVDHMHMLELTHRAVVPSLEPWRGDVAVFEEAIVPAWVHNVAIELDADVGEV